MNGVKKSCIGSGTLISSVLLVIIFHMTASVCMAQPLSFLDSIKDLKNTAEGFKDKVIEGGGKDHPRNKKQSLKKETDKKGAEGKTFGRKWELEVDARYGIKDAIISEGTLFFITYNVLYAVDIRVGKVKWKFEAEEDTYSSAPVISRGRVLFGNGDGYVYAIDARTGEMKWKFSAGGNAAFALKMADKAVHAVSYYSPSDNDLENDYKGSVRKMGTYVWLLDIEGGEVLEKTHHRGCDRPKVLNDQLVLTNGCLLEIKTGKKIASFKDNGSLEQLDNLDFQHMTHMTGKSMVLLKTSGHNEETSLYAVDFENSEISWVFRTGPWYGTLAVAGNVAYVGNTVATGEWQKWRGHVVALDLTTGEEKWRVATGETEDIFSTAVYNDGVLYATTHKGLVYFIDASTGVVKSLIKVPAKQSWSLGTAAQIHDGVLYRYGERDIAAIDIKRGALIWFLSENAHLLALGEGVVIACDNCDGALSKIYAIEPQD